MRRPFSRHAFLAAALSILATIVTIADTTPQTLPFSQNWTNTGLITTSDDWSGVPGVVGYRGDGLTTSTGVDPQTVVADGTAVVDVNANQTNPNTFTTGGVAEFEIADPVAALQGSGTADAPFLLFHVTTTGLQSITVSYNLRDVDGSADNSVQPVALQFRVGSTGNFTNVPAGFVADASTGPGLATLVTPVNAVLPAAADNQALVQIRVITTDAAGSDEWIGVDDVQVTGSTTPQPTDPTGVGAADPSSVIAGNSTQLTVTVTPGANPPSTFLTVAADLSAIGGSATQAFFDDGANGGDATAGDGIFSFLATVPAATTPGAKSLPFSIEDAEDRSGSGAIGVTVVSPVVGSQDIVISEFRVRGPSGGNDEFVELYNLSASPVAIGGWKIRASNNAGTVGTRLTIAAGVTLPAGCHFLATNNAANGYSGPVPGNQNYSTGITDDGGLAITRPDDTVVDQVGMSAGSAFGEGTRLASLGSSNLNRGYERRPGGASGSTTDTDNNANDFQLVSPSDPQNGLVPVGIGSASPSSVLAGDSTLLRVAVTPACGSTNSGTTVVADLSSIGESASQPLLDDGSNGDPAGDGVYTYLATVHPATSPGGKSLPATVTDASARTSTATIALGVQPPPLEIFEIQGNGLASPYVGTSVTTRDNVVTAVAPAGFFIQTPDGRADANPETSNGVFVFTSAPPTVDVGDQVDVSANVVEFFNLTELTSATVTVDSTGNPLPAVVTLDATRPSPNQPQPATELERFEGMIVRVENGVVTSPSDQFGDVPIVAKSARAFREPGILFPGLPGLPVWDGNPEVFDLDPDGLGLPDVDLAAGTVIHLAEGPLSFAFGDYSLLPRTLSYTGAASVVPVRDRNPGEFTVGTQNVLRLFDTEDDPNVDDPVPTPAEYAARLNKFSLLVRSSLKLPDVLVIQEAENLTVLQDFAAQINSDEVAAGDPDPGYAAHLLEGNDVGGIDTGFLTRSTIQVDSVEQFGKDALLSVDGSKLNDRPPLVLRGSYAAGLVPFPIVVIGVHQRSLNGVEGPSSGAARVRQKRHEQAQSLSQYIQSLQEADTDIRLVVAGDFNAFEFTDGYVDVMGQVTGSPDPAGALIPATDEVDPNLTNRTFSLPASERYSFVFDGSAQSLDHVLTSSELGPWVRATEHARGNADAPFAFSADSTTALRASDHDGTVLFVMGDNDGDGFADDADSCDASSSSTTVVIDGCNSGAGNDLFTDGCKITDRIAACAAAATTHEQFTGCVTQLTNQLKKEGFISNKEKSAIQQCAGRARIP